MESRYVVRSFLPDGVFKKNQNAPRPSEHPPARGKNKTSSWHLNRFPYGSNIGSQQYNIGEKPTVILCT